MEQVAVMWDGFIHHAYWSSHHTVTYYIYAPDTTNHKNHQSPLLILPTLMPPISLPLWRSFLLYNLDSISVSNSWTVEQKHWPILDRCSFATDEVPINEHGMTAWILSYTYKGSRRFFLAEVPMRRGTWHVIDMSVRAGVMTQWWNGVVLCESLASWSFAISEIGTSQITARQL
jgi:hypothetical protein